LKKTEHLDDKDGQRSLSKGMTSFLSLSVEKNQRILLKIFAPFIHLCLVGIEDNSRQETLARILYDSAWNIHNICQGHFLPPILQKLVPSCAFLPTSSLKDEDAKIVERETFFSLPKQKITAYLSSSLHSESSLISTEASAGSSTSSSAVEFDVAFAT